MVKEVKRGSSLWIKERDAAMRDLGWQNGYGIFSIGASQIEQVRRYIADQEQHHRKLSFQDEFRLLLYYGAARVVPGPYGCPPRLCGSMLHWVKRGHVLVGPLKRKWKRRVFCRRLNAFGRIERAGLPPRNSHFAPEVIDGLDQPFCQPNFRHPMEDLAG
jgi:hypothetical protein